MASERGKWMPQWAQRTMDSECCTGGALLRGACLGREAAILDCALCRAITRAMIRPTMISMTQLNTFPTLASLQKNVKHETRSKDRRVGKEGGSTCRFRW